MWEKFLETKFLQALERIECGTLSVHMPDGKTHVFSGAEQGEAAQISIYDWRVLRNLVMKGDVGFAEDYRAGLWDSHDLTALITLGLANRNATHDMILGHGVFAVVARIGYMLQLNTLRGSRKNIHAHYDLGNDFYRLWLDPSMTYSAALFDGGHDLTGAQHNKYDRILDCLGRDSGRVLEVGCGWGGFAERATHRHDFAVKGITLSDEQHSYADKRLGRNAQIALEDYRHQSGKYDHIVSIEMFEAVGERYWKTYFGKLRELLHKDGNAVIQTITINDQDFDEYRRNKDFIRSYIFPGGMLPSPTRFNQEAEKAGLRVGNSFAFGHDYARTLEMWLETFDAKVKQVRALGYDDGFIRLWRFYLAACAAGFKTGRTDVMQVELLHA